MEDKPLWDKTEKIIGACIEVHNHLGPGFMETIYQRALWRELDARGIEFGREVEVEIFYKGQRVGKKRMDFHFEDVILEIKAKSQLEPVDAQQLLGYLYATNIKVGLLINFGLAKLEVRRVINNRYKE